MEKKRNIDAVETAASRRALLGAMIFCTVLFAGACSASKDGTPAVTVRQIEELRDLDILLPLMPDSVISIYRSYDKARFHLEHRDLILQAALLIDSLNASIPSRFRIDSLSVDHTLENFGVAARVKNSLYISSSYFFMYNDFRVIRSIVFHEFGHIHYDMLTSLCREAFDTLFTALSKASLLYLFNDGEYSHNSRLGGHPYDDPCELFASAFNLVHNNIEELDARFEFTDEQYRGLLRRVLEMVLSVSFR